MAAAQARAAADGAAVAGIRTVIVNCPSAALALSNCAYVHPAELHLYEPHPRSRDFLADLGLGGLRKFARLSTGDSVYVSRFVRPKANFELVAVTADIQYVRARPRGTEELDAQVVAAKVQTLFATQVFCIGQVIVFEVQGGNYTMTITDLLVLGTSDPQPARRGMIVPSTTFIFESPHGSGIKIVNQRGGMNTNLFKHKEFNFEKLGIGGLDAQFGTIFRRAFASRVFPSHVLSRLGINHVKGMLLYGPPGTGKTLIARQIGKLLNGLEPKVVNGPEVLNKYVGASEENIRNLFADAEKDQKEKGDNSDLHIIIFDEIDAICKARGSKQDSTGVHDGVVNQLLTKIDGVDALNNILLIGMTNRKDLLDEALLRPGRLEVQVEIGLPDEKGRLQILQIHTKQMREKESLAEDVDLAVLAFRTKNFSGAELEGLVRSAASFALNRQVNFNDLTQPLGDEDAIKVTMGDFENALQEVQPAFGAAIDVLEMCSISLIKKLATHNHTQAEVHILPTTTYCMGCLTVAHVTGTQGQQPGVELILSAERNRNHFTLSFLKAQEAGKHDRSSCGKTALAASVAIDSNFPFVRIVSSNIMKGYSEPAKCAAMIKIFEDAYKSSLSIIILDDVERLLEYVGIGPRFSNLILQTLFQLLTSPPPQGRKLLVVATTSKLDLMEDMELVTAFQESINVPALHTSESRKVLVDLDAFDSIDDVNAAVAALPSKMPIKRLMELVERAQHGIGTQARIDMDRFYECLQKIPGLDYSTS
eukprot:SM000012S25454  [mRNA]  locus=s12:1334788:1340370:- [translate_table: standard]